MRVSSPSHVAQARASNSEKNLEDELLTLVDDRDRYDISCKIQKIPFDERNEVIQLALLFIPKKINGRNIDWILWVIQRIPVGERKDVAQRSLPFIYDHSNNEIATILAAIQNILPDDREDVIQKAWPFIEKKASRERENARILEIISSIDPSQRENVTKWALFLIDENMSAWDKARSLELIRNIPVNIRDNEMQLTALFIRNDMTGIEKLWIVEWVQKLPRIEVALLATSLLEAGYMLASNKNYIIDKLHALAKKGSTGKPVQQPVRC